MTDITLANQIINIKSSTLDNRNTRLIASDMRAKTVKIKNDAAHALPIFLA